MKKLILTRTLATLYLNQGHPKKAVEVIERLIRTDGVDRELSDLLERARRDLSAKTGEPAPKPAKAEESPGQARSRLETLLNRIERRKRR